MIEVRPPSSRKRLIGLALSAALAVSLGANIGFYRLATSLYARSKSSAIFPADLQHYAQANRALPPKQMRRIVLFGDSRIEQWSPLPTVPAVEIVNRGIGGQTTAQMQLRFEKDVLALDPDVVLLQMGINDLTGIGPLPNLRSRIYAECSENIRNIVDILVSRRIRVVLLTIVPPGAPDLIRRPIWSDGIVEEVAKLNGFWLRRSQDELVRVVDTARILADGEGRPDHALYADTLHLNADGYVRLNRAVEPVIAVD